VYFLSFFLVAQYSGVFFSTFVVVVEIINITICCFGFLWNSVSKTTISSRCAFAPQCWELAFFLKAHPVFSNWMYHQGVKQKMKHPSKEDKWN
jgi:hypothetical protein